MKSYKTLFYFVLIFIFGYLIYQVLWTAPKQTEVRMLKREERQISHYRKKFDGRKVTASKEYDGKKIIASLENLQQILPQDVEVWTLSAQFYLKEFNKAENKMQRLIWLKKTRWATLVGLRINPTNRLLRFILNLTWSWQRTFFEAEETDPLSL